MKPHRVPPIPAPAARREGGCRESRGRAFFPPGGALVLRHVGVEPGADRGQRRMGEVALEIGPDAGLEREVMRLAVASPQTCEDAENLGVSLRAEDLVMGPEAVG